MTSFNSTSRPKWVSRACFYGLHGRTYPTYRRLSFTSCVSFGYARCGDGVVVVRQGLRKWRAGEDPAGRQRCTKTTTFAFTSPLLHHARISNVAPSFLRCAGSPSVVLAYTVSRVSRFLPAFKCLRLTLAFRILEPTFLFPLCRRPIIAATSPRKRWRYIKTTTFAFASPFLLNTTFNYHQESSDAICCLYSYVV